MKPLLTQVTYRGQPYVDIPIYKMLKPLEVARNVAQIFGRLLQTLKLLERYDCTPLKWKN